MQAPTFEDYKFNRNDVEKIKRERSNYDNACIEAQEKHKRKCKKMGTWTLIASAVAFVLTVVFLTVGNDSGAMYAFGVIFDLAFFATLIAGIIFLTSKYQNRTYKNPNRADYIDVNLENRINRFNAAMNAYLNEINRQKAEYQRKLTELNKAYAFHIHAYNKQFWSNLSRSSFVTELGNLFEKAGYDVKSGKNIRSADATLLLERYNERIAVQCRYLSTEESETEVMKYVKNFISEVSYSENITKIIYVTFKGYKNNTSSVQMLAKSNGYEFEAWDFGDILNLAIETDSYLYDSDQREWYENELEKLGPPPSEDKEDEMGSVTL